MVGWGIDWSEHRMIVEFVVLFDVSVDICGAPLQNPIKTKNMKQTNNNNSTPEIFNIVGVPIDCCDWELEILSGWDFKEFAIWSGP